jgi:N-acetylglucosaminyldiphosphoundecaprenol N-acetyl-beta-D-mannosaminyltransferase
VTLFGVEMDALTADEVLERASELLARPGVDQAVGVNAATVVHMSREPGVTDAVRRAALVHADGMSVVWASRILGRRLPERVTGIDLMEQLLAVCADKGHGVYLLGATSETVTRAATEFRKRHAGLRICGMRDGYWAPDEEDGVVAAIAASGADLLLLALPSPKKELFADQYRDRLGVRLVAPVGGSFDVVAGVTRRAPEWMQHSGLEWAFRFVQEPGRLWRRYLIGNLVFATLTLRQLAAGS